MGDGFDINLGELRAHSSTVENISSQVNSVTGALVSGDAYGMIGQFFAQAILSACGDAQDGILRAAKSFLDVHTGLTDVVDAYRQADEAYAAVFNGTEGSTAR